MTVHITTDAGTVSTLPTGAVGVTATAGAAWVDGAWVEIDDGTNVPAAAFKIVGFTLATPSGAQVGELVLGHGAGGAEVEIGRFAYEIATDAGAFLTVAHFPCGPIAGGTRIAVACATAAGATTVTAKLSMVAI